MIKTLNQLICLGFLVLAAACADQTQSKEDDSAKSDNQINLEEVQPEEIDYLSVEIPINPYAEIDAHARACPDELENNLSTLSEYLGQIATTDREKARSIYVWLTDNIAYDDNAFNTGQYGDNSIESLLNTRKSVCEGFGNLYQAIGVEMGLQIQKVTGYAKGFGYRPGTRFNRTDHAWNAIQIDGQWRIFDATWGQGNGKAVNGKLKTIKEFDPYWFDVDPYEAIFNHFPENQELTFIDEPFSLRQYEELPYIAKSYFEYGFDGKQLFEAILTDPNLQIPKGFEIDTYAKMISAPEYRDLNQNTNYSFVFHVPRGKKMALIDAENNWTFFEKNEGQFSLEFVPVVPGQLKVSTQYEGSGKSFGTLLIYQINDHSVN